MHDERKILELRIRRILVEVLRPAVHAPAQRLEVSAHHLDGEPVPASEALARDFTPFQVGDPWGNAWGTTWFRMTARPPASWAGSVLEAVIDLGFTEGRPGMSAEGLAYSAEGSPLKGLHPTNRWLRLTDDYDGSAELTFFLEAAGNPHIEDGLAARELGAGLGAAPIYRLAVADVAVFHQEVAELVLDIEVLSELMGELAEADPRRWDVLYALNRAVAAVDLEDVVGSATAARAELRDVMRSPAVASAHVLTAVGHAHIDTAWLWPLRETERKAVRTASNALDLMRRDPSFVFVMSQAQQLAWIKQNQPQLFRDLQEKAAEGQFVPVAGMWVESDTNLPGGEALARQFVHGKRFVMEEFGTEPRGAWLPDSFGYSGALPQIMALSGSEWFMSQKISWNRTDVFPHSTFLWEGIDGTRVFSHMPPVNTYNGKVTGEELARAVRNFREKGKARHSLLPFGHGNGGGGPTREMLGRAHRFADIEGAPRVRMASPQQFFDDAAADHADPPVWTGEMYLEMHRGVFASHLSTKQGNRRAEHLLRAAEMWATTAAVTAGAPYPYDDLDALWKRVLLFQFHDILPGSSIEWVHREVEEEYAVIAERLEAMIAESLRVLAGEGNVPLVARSAPHDAAGATSAAIDAAPPRDEAAVTIAPHAGGYVLDNGMLRVRIDDAGLVRSVLQTATGREVISPESPANLLQVHPDVPAQWDAWDIDRYYRDSVVELDAATEGMEPFEDGDRIGIRVRRRHHRSTFVQTVALRPGAERVEFGLDVDWHERQTLVKVAFPFPLRATTSSSETQFGFIERPIPENTSWDFERFEICAHRYLQIHEGDVGVALVNDSTYGHDVRRTVSPAGTTTTVHLTILRGPTFPDPRADEGTHSLTYWLVPSAHPADAVAAGYAINSPNRPLTGAGPVGPLVTSHNPAVVVEALKFADDRSGDLIVRLYESTGTRQMASFEWGIPVTEVVENDLLERDVDGRRVLGGEPFAFRPFQ
ncbi:alpha-mannosidase, partial [Schumannella luteola]